MQRGLAGLALGLWLSSGAAPMLVEGQPAEGQPAEGQAAYGQLREGQLSRRATSIARSVMSPFCPGKTVHACPSPKAGQWRGDIRRWVAAGDDRAVIVQRLQARVPAFELAGRPGRGWDWALPVGAMGVATLGLLWVLRRIRPLPAQARPVEHPAVRDALDDRIDAELEAI